MASTPPPFNSINALPAVTNWDPLNNLQKTRAAINRVRSGQGNMAINLYGHSAIAGLGGGTLSGGDGLYIVGAQQNTIGAALKKILSTLGVPSRQGAWLGTQNLGVTYAAQYDPRFVPGTGWASASSSLGEAGISLGNAMTLQATSATGPLSFTPVESWDRLVTYYATYSAGGTFTVDTGGSVLTTQSTVNATQSIGSVTTSAASNAVQTANVKVPTLGSGVYLIGQESYQSTVSEARIRTIGWNAAKSSDLSDTTFPFSTLNALSYLGGDLTIICCMRNDQWNNLSVSAFQTNLAKIAAQAQSFGDVILFVDHAPQTWPYNNDPAFIAAIYAVAAQYNLPVVDITRRIGSTGAKAYALGYFCPDLIHYLPVGWSDVGTWLGELLACRL
jgi:hypothetical protein